LFKSIKEEFKSSHKNIIFIISNNISYEQKTTTTKHNAVAERHFSKDAVYVMIV
jgi:hypothetical protein